MGTRERANNRINYRRRFRNFVGFSRFVEHNGWGRASSSLLYSHPRFFFPPFPNIYARGSGGGGGHPSEKDEMRCEMSRGEERRDVQGKARQGEGEERRGEAKRGEARRGAARCGEVRRDGGRGNEGAAG